MYNTAKADGTLGYYETSTTYPSTVCGGERVFPVGNIRHHRMPSRDIVQVNDDTSVYPIGLQFSVPEYPDSTIVGHQFLVSVRNESNSTVVDGGVTIPLRMIGENYIEPANKTVKFEYLFYNSYDGGSTYGEFTTIILSPKILVNASIQTFDHIRFNYALSKYPDSGVVRKRYNSGLFDKAEIRLQQFGHLATGTLLYDSIVSRGLFNRAVTGSVFVKPRSTQAPIGGFYSNLDNPSYQNAFNFVAWDIEERIHGNVANRHKYVSLKRNLTPYSDLDSIEYRPLHHNPITRTDAHTFYGGDTVISELTVTDVHFIADTEKVHGNIMGRTFVESTINYSLTHGTEATESACDAKWKPAVNDWEENFVSDTTFKFFSDIYLVKDGNN